MSSCVESGLEAQSTTEAPPSRRVIIRLAVSLVTCRQAETRMPASGWVLMNCLRMVCSTGIDWNAHSVRRFPTSASEMSLMSQATCVCVSVGMNFLLTDRGVRHGFLAQRLHLVGGFP